MNEKNFKKELDARNKQRHLESLDANKDRAHSISIGSSSGGTTEINMRTNSGKFVWNVYQPVQTVEIIYQLAASIGCSVVVQPRNDFASWRKWENSTKESSESSNPQPPFAQYSVEDRRLGIVETQPKMEKENVATKKAVNKRSTKRSRASSK